MQYTEIIKLLDAGYTREEILAMNEETNKNTSGGDDPADKTNKNSSGGEDPKDKTNKNSSGSDDTANEMSGLITEMKEAFAEMRKEFTAMNILNSRQPEEKKVDDIFANIINPARNDKKGE